MKIPTNIKVYGDIKYRGECDDESDEQVTFFNQLRNLYPDSYGDIAVHVRNEQRLSKGQFYALKRHKAEGMVTGAADIIIPGCPAFVCELKRRDHTKSKLTDEQLKYLTVSQSLGAFACIALGYKAALEAFGDYLKIANITKM